MKPLLTEDERALFRAMLKEARRTDDADEIERVKAERRKLRQARHRARVEAGEAWYQVLAQEVVAIVDSDDAEELLRAILPDTVEPLVIPALRPALRDVFDADEEEG